MTSAQVRVFPPEKIGWGLHVSHSDRLRWWRHSRPLSCPFTPKMKRGGNRKLGSSRVTPAWCCERQFVPPVWVYLCLFWSVYVNGLISMLQCAEEKENPSFFDKLNTFFFFGFGWQVWDKCWSFLCLSLHCSNEVGLLCLMNRRY